MDGSRNIDNITMRNSAELLKVVQRKTRLQKGAWAIEGRDTAKHSSNGGNNEKSTRKGKTWKTMWGKGREKNKQGIRIGTWNKGGSYCTKFTTKIVTIEEIAKSNKMGVMGISEANIKKGEKQQDLTIPGYITVIDRGRESETGMSRTAILIRKDLSYKIREDLMGKNFPETWVELGEKGKKKILICQIYREFKKWGEEKNVSNKEGEMRLREWFQRIQTTLEQNREIWIMGDWNADISRRKDGTYDRRKIAQVIYEELEGRGFTQIINEGTHHQGGKLSKIDLIFTNRPEKISQWGTEVTGGSHSMIHATRESKYKRRKVQVRRRVWKEFTQERMEIEMNKIDWNRIMDKVETCEELDSSVENLENKVREVMEKVAPIKIINNDPDYMGEWMDEELKKRKEERNKTKLKLITRGRKATAKEWSDWKKLRNKVNADIEKAKKVALRKKADNDLEHSGNMHNAVKDLLGWRNGGAPEMLIKEGKLTRNPEIMAEILKDTYKDKLREVEKKVGDPEGDYLRTLRNMMRGKARTFRFQTVTEKKVMRKIKDLDDKPSMGKDDISYGVIKRMLEVLVGPITKMINASIRIEHHPKPERIGAVKPLFKGGEKKRTDPTAYRPVNLLPAIGRVQEGLLADQMNEFSEEAENLPPGMHGYRKNLGTTTALLEMQESVHCEIEKGKIVSVAFLDISAGFDTVPHTYLLRKLEMLGYEDSALRWIASYLKGRTQQVQVEASFSKEEAIIKGVPQGGPMSPIFFREYTTDLIMVLHKSPDWEIGEKEDRNRIAICRERGEPLGTWGGVVSKRSLEKENKDKEDRWDLRLALDKNYEHFLEDRKGIGPERRQIEEYGNTSRATLYADDSSARESGMSMKEIKGKTELMLAKLFDGMRKSRLAINTGKTQFLLLRTQQKKRWMDEKGEPKELVLNVEGKEIKEQKTGKLLGLVWSNDMDWKDQVGEITERFSEKVKGVNKVIHWLSFKRRKELVESSLISILRYGLELVSGGSEKLIEKLGRLQSKAARLILNRGRRNWSRSEGFKTLGWLTIQQMAAEASIRTFLKVIQTKRPQSLYEALTEKCGRIREIREGNLKSKTKIRRKTWSVRCLRWNKLLPMELKKGDINKEGQKKRLKIWIRKMIPPKGDDIFKGKVRLSKNITTNGRRTKTVVNEEEWLTEELTNHETLKNQREGLWEAIEGTE